MYTMEKPQPHGYSRARIEQLAQPKKSKQEWLTQFEDNQLKWGDKEPMWIIKPQTLNAKCGERTKRLSKPKLDFKDHKNEVHLYTYSCGRVSPLLAQQKIRKIIKNAIPSDRIKELAKPKSLPRIDGKLWTYSCGRDSPIWEFKTKNISCQRPSSSDVRLALPKIHHKDFVPNRELRHDGRLPEKFMAKLGAKGDSLCTERLESLAEPKKTRRQEDLFIDMGYPEKCIRPVLKPTMNHEANDRILELAKPNESRYTGYVADRFTWPVRRGALKYQISDRTGVLATPVIRPSMEHTQFDADAFFVKAAAKKAKCSQRVEELAAPIQR